MSETNIGKPEIGKSNNDRREIALDQWIATQERLLAEFAEHWKAHHTVDPDHWPAKLWPEDWHEQFNFFSDNPETSDRLA